MDEATCEREFWRTMASDGHFSVQYAMDQEGGASEALASWNLQELPLGDKGLLGVLGDRIPGVRAPSCLTSALTHINTLLLLRFTGPPVPITARVLVEDTVIIKESLEHRHTEVSLSCVYTPLSCFVPLKALHLPVHRKHYVACTPIPATNTLRCMHSNPTPIPGWMELECIQVVYLWLGLECMQRSVFSVRVDATLSEVQSTTTGCYNSDNGPMVRRR
eukprot:9484353-Pyramimonas_sp.AAC.2